MATRRNPGGRPVQVKVHLDQGVFMISVAARLAEMHPQTLRMYEARGLIEPKRSPKGTRLYSHADVERLRRIQAMTAELGLNLAGVERVLELESQLERMRARVDALEQRARRAAEEMEAEIERVRSSFRAELVPYRTSLELVRSADAKPFKVPIAYRGAAGTSAGGAGATGTPGGSGAASDVAATRTNFESSQDELRRPNAS